MNIDLLEFKSNAPVPYADEEGVRIGICQTLQDEDDALTPCFAGELQVDKRHLFLLNRKRRNTHNC